MTAECVGSVSEELSLVPGEGYPQSSTHLAQNGQPDLGSCPVVVCSSPGLADRIGGINNRVL